MRSLKLYFHRNCNKLCINANKHKYFLYLEKLFLFILLFLSEEENGLEIYQSFFVIQIIIISVKILSYRKKALLNYIKRTISVQRLVRYFTTDRHTDILLNNSKLKWPQFLTGRNFFLQLTYLCPWFFKYSVMGGNWQQK